MEVNGKIFGPLGGGELIDRDVLSGLCKAASFNIDLVVFESRLLRR